MLVNEIRRGDKVMDNTGKVYRVVSIEKDGSLKIVAKGITRSASQQTVVKMPAAN